MNRAKKVILKLDKGNFGTVTITEENEGIYINYEKYGVSRKCIRVTENGVKCADAILDGRKFNGIALDKEQRQKVGYYIKHFKPVVPHVCWECGRTFYHKPADDGTCGEC